MKQAHKVDGLGKNRDKASEKEDFAKKQSDAQPAAENLDMMPNSVNKTGEKNFDNSAAIHEKASNYAEKEHEKADNWEDHSAKKNEKK
jgi:hypothetical protein